LLQTSGIQDADKQLGPAAHYTSFNPVDFEKAKAVYQAQLDHGPPLPSQSSGFAELLQVASAGAIALQQSSAGGNTIAAQQAAMAQYNQNVAAITSDNGSAVVPGSTSASDTAGNSSSASPAGPSGGGLYSGPNAEWVHKLLSTAGSYSCAPVKAPSHPNTFACSGRDGYVYSAQQLAWAAECSAQTGHTQDANADANALLDTLKNAGDLCQAQSMATSCTTDRIISCNQLPHH